MEFLQVTLKPLLIEAVKAAYPQLNEDELLDWVSLEAPRDSSHGDFACPVALRLAKTLGENPVAIAERIAQHLPKDFRIGDVSVAAPGFVNILLAPAFLEESVMKLESDHGVRPQADYDRPVIVEYPSTNAAKHMGAHHVLTTMIGDALANLFEFSGREVLRINHLGDWGTHFGKLIYAFEEWGDKTAVHKNPTEELTKLYVKFNQEAEKDPNLDDKAREIFKSLEEGDELRLSVWKWIVQESIEELNEILKRLGIEVNMHMGESFYLKMADDVLEEGKEKGLFVAGEEGALIFPMGKDQTPALIQKKDGTTLYLTRDVATVKYRVETWHPEAIFYVVDHAQSLHFKQDFAIAKALDYTEDTQLEHIAFGRMRFADGSMSTRKGNVIKLTDLLDEAVERAGKMAAERGSDLPREELMHMREVIGTSSVKYGILSQDRNKDIVFDWNKIISLEGNSAPYLLYTYARGQRVLHKVREEFGELDLSVLPKFSEEAELHLARKLVLLPGVIDRAIKERKPHILCTHLYELAQAFNRFYEKVPVSQAETQLQRRSRAGLIQAALLQLKTGLQVLGIPVLDRM